MVTREFGARLDIDQVLQRVLSAIVASVGAYDAHLLLFDLAGGLEKFFFIDGFKERQLSQATVELIGTKGLAGWVKEHRESALIKDTNADPRWYADNNTRELFQVRSAMAVPIQLPEQLLGVLTITATQPNYFDDDDLAMLSIIADQTTFAITNARLYKVEQRRHRLANTLASVARNLNSTLDLREVLGLILEQLSLVVEYDSSSILLLEDDILSVRAARGFEDMQDALKVTIPLEKGRPNYRAVIQKRPILLNDVDAEPGWTKSSSSQKVRSWIGAPLIAQDEVIGMLTVDSHQLNKYTEENVQEVAAFADQAATAVANAQAVALLRSMEDSYSDLFEDSADMILITNYQGLILDANRKACQMLRRTKEIIVGSDLSFIDHQLQECLTENTNRLAERMRQDMINMLVHDLRGPVGNLINMIELIPMLVTSIEEDPKLRNFLTLARRSGQEVRDLVDSMLDVGRLEAGEIYLQRSLVDLEEIIQAVKDQVMPRALSKQMELVINPLPENIPEVWIDQSMIRRILINLVDNAIKYTPPEGQISLTTTMNGETLRFAVKDNGPGISKANQARIFNKFSRVDHSANAPTGVGLGLAFCKLAAEAHDGSISIESQGIPGQGSTFYLTIPIIEPPDEE
ncbi:MAG: GAF domain-containing sensor histidine kinase [Chloroflexi bacterium]|nr:GAF domain-containing sensor histidine kinase [Chloroflexota bacterium]